MMGLQQYALKRQSRSDAGAKWWSTSYHLAFGIAGVLGIVVSLIAANRGNLTVWGVERDFAISLLSATAAILTFIGGFGGFERKWRANRVMRAEMDKILLDLTSQAPDMADLRTRLFTAIDRHEAAIPGEVGAGAKMAADTATHKAEARKPAEGVSAADLKKAEEAKKAAG